MRKGKYASGGGSHNLLTVGLILLVVVFAVAFLVTLGILIGEKGAAPEQVAETTAAVEKDPSKISVPGYEFIRLKANTKKQDKMLSNPANNSCLFRLSLILEDGTVIWESDYIKPGKNSDPIKLAQPLAPGDYPATLKYDCFTMDRSRTPLNSAEIGADGVGAYNGPMILNATGINGTTKHIQITTTFDNELTDTTDPANKLSYIVMPHDDQPGDTHEIEQTDFANGMTSGQVFYWYPYKVTNPETSEEEVTPHPLYKSENTVNLPSGIAVISTTTIEIPQDEWNDAEPDTYTDTITFSVSVQQGAAFAS